MTFQPPPPPPPPPGGPTPPPPPGGQPYGSQPPGQPPTQQWGAPAPGQGGYNAPGSGINAAAVNPLDWALIAAGVLAFIFSLFNYYKVTVSAKGFGSASATASAWHGFFGWFAALMALVGSALVAMALFAPQVKMPVPARLAALGAYAVAALCVILAIFIIPGDTSGTAFSGIKVDKGHGFAFWIDLLLILAGLVLALMRAQQTNTALPGALNNLPKIGK